MACVEDKIVQWALVMILERIYEVDFDDNSYVYRPGKACHQALGELGKVIATRKVNWISDAKRYQSTLVKRLGRFGLSLAPEKTKLIRFGRFAARDSKELGEGAPKTFDFLGFTHYCGLSRAGKFKLKRRTSKKKLDLGDILSMVGPDAVGKSGAAKRFDCGVSFLKRVMSKDCRDR